MPKTNGTQYDSKKSKNVHTKVCIIGSGPAGITAAWHLLKNGVKDVTLIEGSRTLNLEDSRRDKKYLYDGKADGLFDPNEKEFLLLPYPGGNNFCKERERIFGGTSAHWAGQCRPLDKITFEERAGFPGWPIKRTDLDPYYAKASAFLELYGNYYDSNQKNPGYNFTTDFWAQVLVGLGTTAPKLDYFDTEMYQWPGGIYNFSKREFADGNEKKTIEQTDVNVILNATLVDIDHSGGRVTRLHVASLDDHKPNPQVATEFFIYADAYVLACGAVANARQLLLSNAGNEHYQVGHYFMCHPIPRWGYPVVTIEPASFLTAAEQAFMTGAAWSDQNGVTVAARLSPKDEQQKDLKVGGCWFDGASPGGIYYEMRPNHASCVTLNDTPDPVFPQKKQTRITWVLSDTDQKTYEHLTQRYKEAILALKRGNTVSFASWEDVKRKLMVNGHHIGTTRMSDQPQDGVVDKNLKVHTLDKLYVAGSSVFPTAGISNPTFTIVTLSIRLAEHLSGLLKG